jgi:adenylate kinase
MRRVVLMGPPGAGKGTQGTLLAKRWRVPHVASGAILRRALANPASGDALSEAAQVINDGGFVTDEVANAIVFRELDRPAARRGFVLDGYPRDVAQAEALENYLSAGRRALNAVVALQIDEGALIARLAGRLTCPLCGATYHIQSAPPAREDVCDNCGAVLIVREDDEPESIRTRLALYAEKTEMLTAFYATRGLLWPVDAAGAEDAVAKRVLTAVEAPVGAARVGGRA